MKNLNDCKIETRKVIKAEDFIRSLNIVATDIQDIVPDSIVKDSQEDTCTKSQNIHRTIEKVRRESLTVFTDGSVINGPVGCGACSAVLLPLENDMDDPVIKTKAVGMKVTSDRCETEGILLGMELLIQYVFHKNLDLSNQIAYIFSDCSNAIDIITKKVHYNKHPEIFDRMQYIREKLNDVSCIIRLIKIPGHTAIYGNEVADEKAREEALKIANGTTTAPNQISSIEACRLANEIARKSWQRRWNEESTGRQTYEYIPAVGTKIIWPNSRDIGISYCRILLNDTMLNKDSHKSGTCESPICECGVEEETVTDMLFYCKKYDQFRSDLIDTLEETCATVKVYCNINEKVHLLLASTNEYKIKKINYFYLKEALFEFIGKTGRKL